MREKQLRRIQVTLGRVNKIYSDMRTEVVQAHSITEPTLDEAQSLMRQRNDVATKLRLLSTFRTRFILTDDEVAALTSTAEAVNDEFFLALSKAKSISKDCEVLLGFENQTLGLEIMDQTSKHLNMAFQKLYKWVQREFKTLNLENPQLNPSIRRAIRVLAERPSLFQSCLDFFADARQRTLSDSFHLALTGVSVSGQQDSSTKPIEMTAHDPLRYVGDMLAWIHSATVGEREALEVLFMSDGDEIAQGLRAGRANDIWQYIDEDNADGAGDFNALEALNDLVDRDVSAAARSLRQRVEQVVQSNEDTILAYRLATLLGFYRFTFARLLGDGAALLELLTSLESEALRQFRSLVRDHIATLQGEFQQAPSDLGPPDFLVDALKQLKAIMQNYETSMSASQDREADFQPILSEAFDPFLSGSESMARAISGVEGTIFFVNCLLACMATLGAFDFTKRRIEDLQSRVDAESAKLSASQYDFIRHGSGMDDIMRAVEDDAEKGAKDVATLRKSPALQAGSLLHASQTLDEFLPSALMDATEKVKQLQDARLARAITEAAAEKFCGDFERIEELLASIDEGQAPGEEQSLRAVFPRTTGEIRVLLS